MSENVEKQAERSIQAKLAPRAFQASVATGVLFALLSAAIAAWSRSARTEFHLFPTLLIALASFIGAWLSRRQKSEAGILVVVAAILAAMIGRVFTQKGLAIPIGLAGSIIVTALSAYALTYKWAWRAISAAVFTALLSVLIDQFTTSVEFAGDETTVTAVSLILGAGYLVVVALRFPKFNLRTKLVVGFLTLSVVPLIALGWLTHFTSQDILLGQIRASLVEGANTVSGELEDFVNAQIQYVEKAADHPNVLNYISLSPEKRQAPDAQKRIKDALEACVSSPHVVSCVVIDENGVALADAIAANVGKNYQAEDFFKKPFSGQPIYVSSVIFAKEYSFPVIYFSAPVYNSTDRIVGALLAVHKADSLQTILSEAIRHRVSGTEYSFIVDDVYFVNLGHSSRTELLHKTYLELGGAGLLYMQGRGIIRTGKVEEVSQPQPEIVEALRKMGAQKSFRAASWENDGALAEFAAVRVPNTPWIAVTAQPLSAIAVLTENQTRATVTASLTIIFIAGLIGLFVSNVLTSPILELTRVAERFSSGDFSQPAKTRTRDEIGALAGAMNKMSAEIKELIASLEKRVEERTAELASATAQSEKRARDLQIIAEISRRISTEKDVDKLLPLITREVSERFGFYHIGVFLLSENKKYAVLRAANSEGGQVMLRRQHKLEVGQTGIVGYVAASGKPRIALDTGADKVYFNNPDLPETRSEMALPLSTRGEVLGVLDVQSKERDAFSESDVIILSVLADQIAIAIENARLLEESRKALAESQAVFREYLAEAWQSKLASNIIGYYQGMTGGGAITKSKLEELGALESGKKVLSVPITLRGQTIGSLNILLDKERGEIPQSQLNVVKAIAERLGLALENARLFEETSSRAARERTVAEITTKIRGTNNPEEMIRTAMEEIKRALGATRVEIVPQKAGDMKDK